MGAELLCVVFVEAIMLSVPILITAALAKCVVKLARRLCTWQRRPLTAMLRLAVVTVIILVGMPWFLGHLATCVYVLLRDFHHFIGLG